MTELETFFPEEGDTLGSAIRLLFDCGCCVRCVLRFIGEKQTSVYRQTDEELQCLVRKVCKDSRLDGLNKPESGDHGNSDSTNGSLERGPVNQGGGVCAACLGILQPACCDGSIQTIGTSIGVNDYDFSSFLCSVSVPVSTLIRKHSLWIYMKESFSDVYSTHCEGDITDIKEVWKWRCGPLLADALSVPFNPASKFSVCIKYLYEKSDNECGFLRDEKPGQFTKRKTHKTTGVFTRVSVAKSLGEIKDENFKSCVQTPPTIPVAAAILDPVVCEHESIFVAGRYNKYSRTLSQTPWLIDGVRKSETSVEELVSHVVLDKFRPKTHKFSSSGREDVDVRMLGRGRPFILELVDPHVANLTQSQITDMQKLTNEKTDLVHIRDLQIVSKEDTNILKLGEETKRKLYSATCWAARRLTSQDMEQLTLMKDTVIKQRTPIRVLHRRNLSTREKTIHSIKGELIDDHHFKLKLSTQAGTYIKEFVHGDFGRTYLSMGDYLETDCDILELDVEEVEIDWPKRVGEDETATC